MVTFRFLNKRFIFQTKEKFKIKILKIRNLLFIPQLINKILEENPLKQGIFFKHLNKDIILS